VEIENIVGSWIKRTRSGFCSQFNLSKQGTDQLAGTETCTQTPISASQIDKQNI
jgi:hypothetical protein